MNKNHVSFLQSLFSENRDSRRKILLSIKAKADSNRTMTERLADWMTAYFGSMKFLLLNFFLFTFWIIINTNQVKYISAFDPYPFNLLTNIVSLEAIFLAIFVLISQNRSSKVDDIREEINLQIDLIEEKEITKIMKMLAILLERQGVDISLDSELRKLVKPISEEEIKRKLEKEIL